MNKRKTTISAIGVILLSMLLLSAAAPAAARGRGHGGRSSRRSSRSRRHCDSGLSIGFGLSNRSHSTTVRYYVPGYYQNRAEQILVEPAHYAMQTQHVQVEPGRYEIRTIPAVEKIVQDEQGNEYRILLQPSRTETVYIPPRYEQRLVRVWVPDRYETRTTQVWVPGHWVSQPSYSYSAPRSWISIGGTIRF